MKLGICVGGDAEKVKVAKECGFDYVESCFDMLVKDEVFAPFKAALEENGMPCLAVNCFLPGTLKVTGNDVDFDKLTAHISKGMANAKTLGIQKVVFGSGGARNVPEGFAYADAYRQIAKFLREIAGPLAEKNGLTVVIEPLRRKDSNIINSAQEGAAVAAIADHPSVKSLVDLYHMVDVNDNEVTVRRLTGFLRHSHIAEPVNRKYPRDLSEYDYKAFFEALDDAGCDTCSIEGKTEDFNNDAYASCKFLKSLL